MRSWTVFSNAIINMPLHMEEVMVSITFIRRKPCTVPNGLSRYADALEEIANGGGAETEDLYLTWDRSSDGIGGIFSMMSRQFLRLISERGKQDVYHITDEACALFIPFMKGRRIVTFHHIVKQGEGDSKTYYRTWKFLAAIAVRYSDMIIAQSSLTKREIMSTFPVEDSRIQVIPSSINPRYRTLQNVEKKNIIGCIGGLNVRKNFTSAVKSFKLFLDMPFTSGYELHICGIGPDRDAITEEARRLGIADRVVIISELSDDKVVEYYNSMKVLANPSLHEGLGLATLEAQRCSTPVVYFKNANMPSEVTRYAIPSDDEREFAKNMHKLVTDREYYEKTVAEGKEYADGFGCDFRDRISDIYGLTRVR